MFCQVHLKLLRFNLLYASVESDGVVRTAAMRRCGANSLTFVSDRMSLCVLRQASYANLKSSIGPRAKHM